MTDIDNDKINYVFELYTDELLTDLLVSDRVEEMFYQPQVPEVYSDRFRFFWRACAEDEHGLRSQ